MNTLAIIEDEKSERDNIRTIISENCPDIMIIGEADSVSDGYKLIKEKNPQILVLDIEIKEGTSFEILEKLNTLNFYIIFLTAFEKFAIQAFKMSAVDYILKPYKSVELVNAINEASDKINHEQYVKKLETLLRNINVNTNKQIVIHTSEAFFIIDITDIIRCMADDNYTKFYMENGETILVSKPLKKYEDLLSGFGFCRVHQSHLVNLNKLIRFNKIGKSSIILKNNEEIPVSKGMKPNIVEYLKSINN